MSYILDALRRADAERQRGAVPGLHAQPMAGVLNEAAAAPGAPARRLGWLAALLALLGLAVAAGWLLRPAAAPGGLVAALSVPALPPGPSVAPPPGLPMPRPQEPPTGVAPSLPPAPEPAPGAVPTAVPSSAPALPAAAPGLAGPAPGPRTTHPLPVPMPMRQAASASRPAMAASSSVPVAALSPAPAPTQPAPAAAPARLPGLAELPEAQRRELGSLVVGGAMHAEQAAMRIVILNGQVFHEGDKLGPDLLVQQIRLKSVVLSHRGQRFELPF